MTPFHVSSVEAREDGYHMTISGLDQRSAEHLAVVLGELLRAELASLFAEHLAELEREVMEGSGGYPGPGPKGVAGIP